MSTPQLPPELWNLAVVITICVLLGWMMRLLRLVIIATDVRNAVESNAILHLKDLGASLMVLRNASMWHLHQLLRTTMEVKSTKMVRLHVPFDVVSSSLEIAHASGTASSLELTFCVRAACAFQIQVFWGVQHEDLGAFASLSGYSSADLPTLSSSASSSRQLITPALRSLSVDATMRALRTAPSKLGSRLRRQRRRHQLHDEVLPSDAAGGEGITASESVTPNFVSHSDVFKYAPQEGRLSLLIPHNAIERPHSESESLINEVDQHDPATLPSPAARGSRPPSSSAGFSAVIVVQSTALTQDPVRPKAWGKMGSKHSGIFNPDSIICQCVAIDFLPTPLKSERYTPAVVKKINFTKSAAYIAQEIYGRDACSECAICLEGAASVVLLPCRHFCVCRACLQEIDRCPICRAAFATYVCYADENPGKL